MSTMSMESVGHTSAAGMWVRTLILRNTRIRAIEEAVADRDKVHATAADVQERLTQGRYVVERFDENARAEAIVTGAAGEKFDASASRERKAEAVRAVEDLELEAVAAWSAVDSATSAYTTAMFANLDKLRQSARDEAATAMHEMTVAREALVNAAARLGAALPVLSGASEIANGMQPSMISPRTAADDVNDAGHPGVHAGAAAEQVDVAIAWLSRWISRADEQAAERKAAAKAAKSTTAQGGAA